MKKKWEKSGCYLLCVILLLTAIPFHGYEVKAAAVTENETGNQTEAGSEAGTETGSQAEPGSEAETGSRTEPGSEAGTEEGSQAEPGNESGTETGNRTEPENEAETEEGSQADSGSEIGTEEGSQTESGSEAGTEEGQSESENETGTEEEGQTESESETESQEETENETETETETETINKTKEEVIVERPEITVSATAGGLNYNGTLTSKQIVISVEVKEFKSGVSAVKAAFVPEGSEYSENLSWERMTFNSDSGKYEIVLGKNLEEKKVPDDSLEAEKLLTKEMEEDGKETETIEFLAKNGTYYFTVVSNDGKEFGKYEQTQKVNIRQQNIVNGRAYADRECGKTGWYNIKTGYPDITFLMPTEQEHPEYKMTTHFEVYKADKNGVEQKIKSTEISRQNNTMIADESEALSKYTLKSDGRYFVYVWTEDEIGNKSVIKKYKAYVDTMAPDQLSLNINEDDITKLTNAVTDKGKDGSDDKKDAEVVYEFFYKDSVVVTVNAQDKGSGIDKDATVWHKSNATVTGESLTADSGTRGCIEAEVYDNAGNASTVGSKGVVVDSEAPVGNDDTGELTIEPENVNENGFINGNFTVNVSVKDKPDTNNAALKNVSYEVDYGNGRKVEGNIFDFGTDEITETRLNDAAAISDKIEINTSESDGETIVVTVTAEDNCGNIKTSSKTILLDVTKPEITVEFDKADVVNEKYYKKDRTAHITIKEKNFDPKGVKLNVIRDGAAAGMTLSADSWKSSGDMHTAELTFSEDGLYNFAINCTDLAGNEAEGPAIEPFIIDKTSPDVMVTYDSEPYEEGYFNSYVTATITVKEQNFNEKDFTLNANPQAALGAWTHNGDSHTAKLTFKEDGTYSWKVDCTDLAGNRMAEMEEEQFIIDTRLPEVSITGVENESANSGEIIPVVMVTDENLRLEDIEIQLTNGNGQVIALEEDVTQIPKGFSYQLLNVSKQKDSVYHLDVKGVDRAGNIKELNYRFSLNRNGSTYDFSSVRDMVDRVYNKYENVTDIKILETNIDKIENFDIYVNRNGKMIQGTAVSKEPSKFANDTVYYMVNLQESESNGYTYEYTIIRGNFKEEGTYNITFTSVDRAGNRMSNTQAQKDATIGFIVDDTAPMVYIDGVEGDTVYNAEELKANVCVTDNFGLKEAEFYLVDETGKKIETWNYVELAKEEGENITLTIPGSEKKQSLLFTVSDEAGNEMIAESGEEGVPSGFLITVDEVPQTSQEAVPEEKAVTVMTAEADTGASVVTPIIHFVAAIAAGVIMIGTAVWIGRRKRLKELGEEQ